MHVGYSQLFQMIYAGAGAGFCCCAVFCQCQELALVDYA